MARYGCLALAVVVAMAVLIFIVFLWSGWLNRPVGHVPAAVSVAHDSHHQKQDLRDFMIWQDWDISIIERFQS